MKICAFNRIIVILCLAVLSSCKPDSTQTALPSEIPRSESQAVRPNNLAIELIDVNEREVGAQNVLAFRFNTPIDVSQNLERAIRISPSASRMIVSPNAQSVFVYGIEPATDYQYEASNVTAQNGSVMSAAVAGELTTRNLQAYVRFNVDGAIINLDTVDRLGLDSLNAHSADLNLYRIKEDQLHQFFVNPQSFSNERRGYTSNSERDQTLDHLQTTRVELTDQENYRFSTAIAVDELGDFSEPGIYFLTASRPGSFDFDSATWISVTDIGLQLRRYNKELVIFAQSIRTGAALHDVKIERFDSRGELIDTIETDEFGLARFDRGSLRSDVFVATKNDETSVIRLWQTAYELSEYIDYTRPFEEEVHAIYSTRDLYRAGDTAYFTIFVKDHDGNPSQLAQSLSIRDANGQIVYEARTIPDHLGVIELPYSISTEAARGYWSLMVEGFDTSEYFSFRVEDFMPETLALSFNNDSNQILALQPESPIVLPIAGRYLYGAPADGNSISISVEASPVTRPIAELSDYHFGSYEGMSSSFDFGDLTLDSDGRMSIELSQQQLVSDSTEQPKVPSRITWWTSLYESGGRALERRYHSLWWPYPHFIGIKSIDDTIEANSEAKFSLVRSDVTGALASTGGVNILVERTERNSYWTYTDQRGWFYERETRTYPVWTERIEFDASEALLSFPVEWGEYSVTLTDDQGGVTMYSFRAGSAWYNRMMTADQEANPEQATITLQSDYVTPGETTIATVTSPIRGRGIWTIETDRVIKTGLFNISEEPTDIEFVVPAGLDRHDAYLTVFVVSREGSGETIRQRAFGIEPLNLDRRREALEVELTMENEWQPLTSVDVSVDVTDSLGNPVTGEVQLKLAAVDLGALSVSNYSPTNPWDVFYQRRSMGLSGISDLYGYVLEPSNTETARIRWGGDAQMLAVAGYSEPTPPRGAQSPTEAPQIVAIHQERVQVVDGKALLTLDLPDFNGALRIFALAYGERSAGLMSETVQVAAPIVTQFNAPRFLAEGDRSIAVLDVRNQTGDVQDLTVSISTFGAIEDASFSQQVRLNDGQREQIEVPLNAVLADSSGIVELEIQYAGDTLERSWTIGTRRPEVALFGQQLVAVSPGQTTAASSSWFGALIPNSIELYARAMSSPDFGLDSHIQFLANYEYACLEQTVSKLTPWIYAEDTVLDRALHDRSSANRGTRIQEGVDRLAQLQSPSGAFRLWPQARNDDPWLTVYAADALLTLRDQGGSTEPVDMRALIKQLQSYVMNPLRDESESLYSNNPRALNASYKAYAAYVLAREGQINLGPVRELYQAYAGLTISPIKYLHFSEAFRLLGSTDEASTARSLAQNVQRPEDIWLGDYGSRLRDLTMQVTLTDDSTLYDELIREVNETRWLNTQERAQLVKLGAMLANNHARTQIQVNGDETNDINRGQFVLIDGVDTSLSNLGNERSFLQFSWIGEPTSQPSRNDFIDVNTAWFVVRDGGLIPLSNDVTVTPGEYVIATTQAVAPERVSDAMLIHLIPAGLELVNPNLTHSRKISDLDLPDGVNFRHQYAEYEAYRDDRYIAVFDLSPNQASQFSYLLRATTTGEYTVPSTLVESMYRNERHGRHHAFDRLVIAD